MIVADTNLVAYLLVDGEATPQARAAWHKDPDWILPPLWRSEFLNVLATSVRHGVLDRMQAQEAWRSAVNLLRRSEREPSGDAVLTAALEYEISAYDAQFVVVAMELRVSLVTADRRLALRCPEVATALAEFVG